MQKSRMGAAMLAAVAAACGSSGSNKDDRGLLAVQLSEVPADAGCFQLTVAGAARVFQKSWKIAGQSDVVLHATGVPTGALVAVGAAYPSDKGDCGIIGPEVVATWLSDSVNLTLQPGKEGLIAIKLHPNGVARVTVDFEPDSATVGLTAGGPATGEQGGPAGPGGGQLPSPAGLAVETVDALDDVNFRIYISDSAANAIFLLDHTGPLPKFSRVAGPANRQAGYADGSLSASLFNNPAAEADLRPIWNPPNTGIGVADQGNCALRLVDPEGDHVSTLAGGSCGKGASDGDVLTAGLSNPRALVGATQGEHNLVLFSDGNAIRLLDATAKTVTTLAGSVLEAGALDGTGGGMRLASPEGLAFDGKQTLYIADTGNHAIRALDLVTLQGRTIAGQLGVAGHSDGMALESLLDSPRGLALDSMGGLVITEATNTRRLAKGLLVTTAGAYGQQGNVDGSGLVARFRKIGLAASFQCHFFVADAGNQAVRMVSF